MYSILEYLGVSGIYWEGLIFQDSDPHKWFHFDTQYRGWYSLLRHSFRIYSFRFKMLNNWVHTLIPEYWMVMVTFKITQPKTYWRNLCGIATSRKPWNKLKLQFKLDGTVHTVVPRLIRLQLTRPPPPLSLCRRFPDVSNLSLLSATPFSHSAVSPLRSMITKYLVVTGQGRITRRSRTLDPTFPISRSARKGVEPTSNYNRVSDGHLPPPIGIVLENTWLIMRRDFVAKKPIKRTRDVHFSR